MSIEMLMYNLSSKLQPLVQNLLPDRTKKPPSLHYRTVDKEKIRLLRVDLSTGEPHYSLIDNVSPGDPAVRYTALSYTWGSAWPQRDLSIDGGALKISSSLHNALRDICAYYQRLGQTRVHLWIDQICINQQDTVEKGPQVQNMSKVYACAETVLVWLSVPTGALHPQRDGTDDEDWLWWARMNGTRLGTVIGPRQLNSTGDPDEDWRKAWSGILSIVMNPWWERAWIYQEFMLSKEAMFLVDGHALSWQELQSTLHSFSSDLELQQRAEALLSNASSVRLQYRWPRSHFFRCEHCEQIKGSRWLWAFLTNPSNWIFIALCYVFIHMLPREMAGHVGYATFIQRTLTRKDFTNGWSVISSCDCNANVYRNVHLLRLPPVRSWRQSEYGARWLMSTCKDELLWAEAGSSVVQVTVFRWLKALVWDRKLPSASTTRVHWVILNIVLHGMLMHLPTSDFNDHTQDRKPRFVSWRGIHSESKASWSLVLSILKQREDGIDNLPLSTVIERARNTRSTDPRDKVYAFLGVLGFAGSECAITVDYTNATKTSAVLTQASEQLMLRERTFDQLVLAIEDKAGSGDSIHLSSWVPNWSRPRVEQNDYTRRRGLIMDGSLQFWQASRDRRPIVSFYTNVLGQRILRAQAIYIDTLGARRHWIKPNSYIGRDHGGDITTLAILSNPPRTGDEIWLLIGAKMPFVLRDNALANAFGDVVASTVGNFMSNRQGIALGKRFSSRRTYQVICEAAIWAIDANGTEGFGANDGSVIDALDAGKVIAQPIDIC